MFVLQLMHTPHLFLQNDFLYRIINGGIDGMAEFLCPLLLLFVHHFMSCHTEGKCALSSHFSRTLKWKGQNAHIATTHNILNTNSP